MNTKIFTIARLDIQEFTKHLFHELESRLALDWRNLASDVRIEEAKTFCTDVICAVESNLGLDPHDLELEFDIEEQDYSLAVTMKFPKIETEYKRLLFSNADDGSTVVKGIRRTAVDLDSQAEVLGAGKTVWHALRAAEDKVLSRPPTTFLDDYKVPRSSSVNDLLDNTTQATIVIQCYGEEVQVYYGGELGQAARRVTGGPKDVMIQEMLNDIADKLADEAKLRQGRA